LRSGAAALLGLTLALAGCGGVDVEQARICERIVPALEAPGATVEVAGRAAAPGDPAAVLIDYRVRDARGSRAGFAICRFAGTGLEQGRLRLEGVTTRAGALSPVEVFMLRRFWLDLYESRGAPTDAPWGPARELAYALQLALNAMTLASIYALLAVGYTLIFGLIGRINLAFGVMAVLGAYVAINGITFSVASGGIPLTLLLPLLLILVGGYGAALGLAVERLVFRPLCGTASQAPLIATLGLGVALQEAIRLTQGAGERWVQPVLSARSVVMASGEFSVTVSAIQAACVLAGLVGFGLLWLIVQRTRFGQALRAAADDLGMAALCGVRTSRLLAGAFALAGCYAAIAGMVTLLRYGAIGFYDGWMLGFKALTAAIVGGIGRIGGAALGAILIAGIETAWAGYLTSAYRDVAIFGLLALVLALRPGGLLGDARTSFADRLMRGSG
jgi:branched-chain amino acid transport system permease protein